MRHGWGVVIAVAANVCVAVFSLSGSAWLWARASEPIVQPRAVPALPAVVEEIGVPFRPAALRPERPQARRAARTAARRRPAPRVRHALPQARTIGARTATPAVPRPRGFGTRCH